MGECKWKTAWLHRWCCPLAWAWSSTAKLVYINTPWLECFYAWPAKIWAGKDKLTVHLRGPGAGFWLGWWQVRLENSRTEWYKGGVRQENKERKSKSFNAPISSHSISLTIISTMHAYSPKIPIKHSNSQLFHTIVIPQKIKMKTNIQFNSKILGLQVN